MSTYSQVKLGAYAQLILECIAHGMRLRVPHNKNEDISLVVLPYFKGSMSDSIGPLDIEPVEELLSNGVLWKLTEEAVNQRMGWKGLGFDGDKADFYCMVQ